jgi:hypothetical protein
MKNKRKYYLPNFMHVRDFARSSHQYFTKARRRNSFFLLFFVVIFILLTDAVPLRGEDYKLRDNLILEPLPDHKVQANDNIKHTAEDQSISEHLPLNENVHQEPLHRHKAPARNTPDVKAIKVNSGDITVDGELDESFWKIAPPATGFVQFEPMSGAKATENTEVRVLFDEYYLYIGATLYDSRPDEIIADEMRRDSDLERNDTFMVIIDTYHDHRSGFYFETNPLGAKVDALVFEEGNYLNFDWNGIWQVEAKKTSDGWQVEMRIPFSTLRFNDKTLDIWGVQFGRLVRRKNESVYWSHIPLDASKWRLSLAGHLRGLKKIDQRKHIFFKPYALIQREEITTSGGEKNKSILFDAGLDIKYFVTPNLTADLTINPDFAQVEADELKINVTRFPLFFPEKREFFLEGSGYFDFGLPEKVQPFYSRRIGIESEKEIPILIGGKLSGKAGDYGLGLLSVQTKEEGGEPETNYSVVRIKKDILERSSIGLIAVNKEPDKGNHNRTYGADLALNFFDHLYLNSFFMMTDTEEISSDEEASFLSVVWQDPSKYFSLSYLDVDDSFNPEVGFVKRTGIKESFAYGELYLRPSESIIRKYSLSSSLLYLTDQKNRMIGRDVNLGLTMTFHSGEYLDVSYLHTLDTLEAEFEIRPGITISEGDYFHDIVSVSASTDESRKVSGYIFMSYGDYFDGNRSSYSASLKLRPSKHIVFVPGFTREEVDLPQGSFDASLLTSTIEYTITTKAFMNALLQWDDEFQEISTNIRFNYEYDPGSDIYLVYNETRSTSGSGLKEQAIVLKITKLWSF